MGVILMTMSCWVRSSATALRVFFSTLVFSFHIHINPIIDHAKAVSDFAIAWSSFQSLADSLKASTPALRKKEDILKLESLAADLKKRVPSLQKNFADPLLKIQQSG